MENEALSHRDLGICITSFIKMQAVAGTRAESLE